MLLYELVSGHSPFYDPANNDQMVICKERGERPAWRCTAMRGAARAAVSTIDDWTQFAADRKLEWWPPQPSKETLVAMETLDLDEIMPLPKP